MAGSNVPFLMQLVRWKPTQPKRDLSHGLQNRPTFASCLSTVAGSAAEWSTHWYDTRSDLL